MGMIGQHTVEAWSPLGALSVQSLGVSILSLFKNYVLSILISLKAWFVFFLRNHKSCAVQL